MPHDKEVIAARNLAILISSMGGPDMRHLPDDELLVKMQASCEMMANTIGTFGISLEQAGKAMQRLSSAMQASCTSPPSNGRGKPTAVGGSA